LPMEESTLCKRKSRVPHTLALKWSGRITIGTTKLKILYIVLKRKITETLFGHPSTI